MEIADLQNQGKQMILVTSAAVSAGMAPLGLSERPQNIREKQALAAVGQGVLMNIYEKMFRDYGQTVGQILLTRMDSYNRKNFMNLRNTLLTLLDMGVIPVINENDAVAIDELKIGDNDTLSAIVASIVDADLLVILSDVDGLYTANPLTHVEGYRSGRWILLDTGDMIVHIFTEEDRSFYDLDNLWCDAGRIAFAGE